MKSTLVIVGLVVATWTYVFVTSLLVYFTDIPEVLTDFWIPMNMLQWVILSVVVVLPLHFWIVYKGIRKKEYDWSIGVPFLVLPYMLGVIAQSLSL